MYNVQVIRDFDATDMLQQYHILQNAKELLAFLQDKHEGFPAEAYIEGSKALLEAMGFIDDELIHGEVKQIWQPRTHSDEAG